VNAIYWASAEVLIAAAQLGSGRELPSPELLRAEMLGMLQQMVSKCRAAGVPDAATAEARYALVAFIDERILKSNWPGRAEWMNNPLQLQLYREYTAGENFFVRMRVLLQHPQGVVPLEVYYLCLALGFTGAAAGADNAQSYLEAARARLGGTGPGTAISVRAIPTDHYSYSTPRRPIVLAFAISCALVVLLGLGLLQWSTSATLQRTERTLSVEAERAKAAANTER
jgi:type IV/VI secretion system ImpK/VasF family protein